MKTRTWVSQFGTEYDVPAEIQNHPLLIDTSWGNDAWPSFGVREFVDDDRQIFHVCIWIRHPDLATRMDGDCPSEFRFAVYAVDNRNGDEFGSGEYHTAAEAIVSALHIAEQIKAKYADVLKAPNSRFVWNIGAIREFYPDMPEQDSTGAIVLWDRQERRAVVTVAAEYAQAMCLEVISPVHQPNGSPFTNLEAWFNCLAPECLESENIKGTRAPFNVTPCTIID